MAFETFGKPTLDDVCAVMALYLSEQAPLWRKIDKGIYREMEERMKITILSHALKHYKGSVSASSKALGLNRSHLSRVCKNIGLDISQFKSEYPWPLPKQVALNAKM